MPAGHRHRPGRAVVRTPPAFPGPQFHPSRDRRESRGPSLAGRWAAKEAVMKAPGAGVGEIALTDIETLPDASGRPVVTLHGAAADRARKAGLNHWQVSISHDGDYAIAVAWPGSEAAGGRILEVHAGRGRTAGEDHPARQVRRRSPCDPSPSSEQPRWSGGDHGTRHCRARHHHRAPRAYRRSTPSPTTATTPSVPQAYGRLVPSDRHPGPAGSSGSCRRGHQTPMSDNGRYVEATPCPWTTTAGGRSKMYDRRTDRHRHGDP